ncbi:radical SAM protein [Gimibacter soli]|uniref:Radical SAM protein n=1 Tax=Gimibacter soli TaxID=3024400 RepID=A0AAF0BJF1_9PROT|nr:radical SAM protein [Gimibacter soli]WCL53054.1 radical SAM protein [Gimibacter soli]
MAPTRQMSRPEESTLDLGEFTLKYRGDALPQPELLVIGKRSGRHKAVHTFVNILDNDGNLVRQAAITPDIASFIFGSFEVRGSTEAFNIYESDLVVGKWSPRTRTNVSPDLVRHQRTIAEQSFTATGGKLAHHWPIFQKLKETGFGSIIRATLTLHQLCSSNCPFCSTILRNKRDSVSLTEAQAFVSTLYNEQAALNRNEFVRYNEEYRRLTGTDIRLKGLILSGGGQPNLWPHFSEFVRWLGELDLDVGLITNGFPPKIAEDVYERFKWVRLSITPESASPFYPDGRFDRQYIPASLRHNDSLTVGLSYVYGPWTDDDMLKRLDASAHENGFRYVRLLTDCNLTRQAQLKAHQDLADRLFRLGFIDEVGKPLSRIFHQLKYHGSQREAEELWSDGQCKLQSYNVFWDTTGHEENGYSHCYPCDSVTVLADEQGETDISVSERRFNADKWGTVKSTEVHRLFTEPLQPFFDPRDICASCLFMNNNRAVSDLVKRASYGDMNLDTSLEHLNFP